MTPENKNSLDVIDNENTKITELLNKKEDLVALGILQYLDNQTPQHDIDLAIDRESNTYRFIVNNTISLDIPLNLTQIIDMGKFLIELLNKIDEVELEYDNFSGQHIDIQVDTEGLLGMLGIDTRVLGTETMQEIFGRDNTPNDKVKILFRFIQTIRNKK